MSCPVCYEELSLNSNYNCIHKLCDDCFNKWRLNSNTCPECRSHEIGCDENITNDEIDRDENITNNYIINNNITNNYIINNNITNNYIINNNIINNYIIKTIC